MKKSKLSTNLLNKFILIGFLTVLFFSCAPFTKESYLKDFREFIQEVKVNHEHYTEKDWQDADKKFMRLSNEWYDDFKDELTLKEQLEVIGYNAQYKIYKTGSLGKQLINLFLDDTNVNKLKDEIKKYKELGYDDAIKDLTKQAKDLGKDAEKEIYEIFKELNIDPNRYK